MCLLLILFLLIPNSILADPIRQEFFGFRFGMTYEEAKKNASDKDYTIYDDYLDIGDPSNHFLGKWILNLPLPTERKDREPIYALEGSNFFLSLYRNDLKNSDSRKNIELYFGDNKLYEIHRYWDVPDNYDPSNLIQQLINLYGDYTSFQIDESIISKYYILWKDEHVTMELSFIPDVPSELQAQIIS